MIRLALILAVTTFAVDVSTCVAQDPRGSVAIGGLASITPTGDPPTGSVSFPGTGLGGTAAGFTAEAGRFVSRRLSVGFEASVPLRFDGEQFAGYDLFNAEQAESAHRDVLFSGLQVSPPIFPVTYGPLGPEFTIRRGTLGLLVGADYDIRVAHRLDFLTQLRANWVNRDNSVVQDTAVVGLGSFILRPAMDVRFSF